MFNQKQDKAMADELSKSNNTIGKGTLLNGDIETFGSIRLDGRIKGNIKSKAKVVIGTPAKVQGNILAQNAEIAGEIRGQVEVADMLILKPSAIIHGDINTNKLVVESGATFNGACKMGAVVKEISIGKKPESAQVNNEIKKEIKTA